MERAAYLAGQWYPAGADACRAAIATHAQGPEPEAKRWRGLIGPHAGWAYSGDAAARAYRVLASARPETDLVVVFGSHRGAGGPNTIFGGDAWETPLGRLAVDTELAASLARELALAPEPVEPRYPDNAVELHLPFVRYFFPEAELLMLGVAAAPIAEAIGTAVGQACRERNVVFVGSTDLTHYGPNYGFVPQGLGEHAVDWVRNANDRGFIDAVLAYDAPGLLTHATEAHSACCPGAVAATLRAIEAFGAHEEPLLLDHYLSFDVSPANSFVGYASILL